ncbi:helix-hairpin-helix domain-containing protein [Ornithinibacillus sp. BX22]|uniref:Helix-hairpin-helix domain-containing protein n=3 Tax=Bacillaceae TaxID=186817 RepID=A0A923L9E9_9BACI|nr:helix-hairpin-helix domain-containing protein [Ornithinibacillus hominis]MBS3679519.1 helix-hairpin-helix domain-containing protein [Ornithinibacillus massiliensis]
MVIGIIVVFILFNMGEEDLPTGLVTVDDSSIIEAEAINEPNSGLVVVDIKGEVQNPGVYEIKESSRVRDVVLLAGGFTNSADQNLINLAQKVFDEMVILVPEIGQEGSVNVGESESAKIRINYATVEEIQKLPGIGPSKANAIVEYRDANGYFQQVEDLLSVTGIGEKTLEAIKDELQVP